MNHLVKSLVRRRSTEDKGSKQSKEEGKSVASNCQPEEKTSPRDDEASGKKPREFDPESVPPGLRWWTQTDQEIRAKYDECRAKAPLVYPSFLYEARDSAERLRERDGDGPPRQERKPSYHQHEWDQTRPRRQTTAERIRLWRERPVKRAPFSLKDWLKESKFADEHMLDGDDAMYSADCLSDEMGELGSGESVVESESVIESEPIVEPEEH